ncbi:4-alpha-glucanotransferase [Arthrobacter sp. Hiyo6]|nr:4-alpha-glucanotransferase [Arthrobacter sp. Hiyo6]
MAGLGDHEKDEELLRKLASAHGVGISFRGWDGMEHDVSSSTLLSVLTSLGIHARTSGDMLEALKDAELAPWRRLLPPVVVVREGRESVVAAHVPHGDPVNLWISLEDGTHLDVPQRDHWRNRGRWTAFSKDGQALLFPDFSRLVGTPCTRTPPGTTRSALSW